MDSNSSDTNNMNGDVHLPPRKRLLAVLKKQSCSESSSQCSQEDNPILNMSQSIDQTSLTDFDIRLNDLLKSFKYGFNMSPEEIVDAANSAASAAVKAAKAARVVAEEKAANAAKAVAAAKSALLLVTSGFEETGPKDKNHRRIKLKKHVPVQLVYNKYQRSENVGGDEKLARKLHRTMNSSPRISKHTPSFDTKNRRHKKLKFSFSDDKIGISDGYSVSDGNVNMDLECNGHEGEAMDCEGSNEEHYNVKVDEKVTTFSKDNEVELDRSEVESSHAKEKNVEGCDDLAFIGGRKRGRIKQKKLPLSILSTKDQVYLKDELNLTNSLITRVRTDGSTAHQLALLSGEPSTDNVGSVKVGPTWKCKDFKVSQCAKHDKLVQS